MYIAVDFDGTCVTHDFPNVGVALPNAVEVLKELVTEGHLLILYTMRSGENLQQAIEWFNANDIKLYGINENPSQKTWTQSPKVYAHVYIDDAALGCPLIHNSNDWLGEYFPVHKRPYVNWESVKFKLKHLGILSPVETEDKPIQE